MNRRPKIVRMDDPEARTIVLSDLHGSLLLYQKILKKVQYRPGEDELILLGDLVEKGDENLALLRFIMNQTRTEKINIISGNCDFVGKNILYGYRLEYLRGELKKRKKSLIREMADRLGLPPIDENTDMDQLAAKLRRHYLAELSFLNDLPHAIVTPTKIYVHAGLDNEITIAEDFRNVMAVFQFARRNAHFHKTVICGHMPVSEYCSRIASFNPVFDFSRNIISIDGGNQVNEAGQLNALIFHGDQTETVSVDLLPEAKAARDTRPPNPLPLYLSYNSGHLKILERKSLQTLVFSPALNRTFWIDNCFLHGEYGRNYTNYSIPLKKGDPVRIAALYKDRALIKSRGILGWCYLKDLILPDGFSAGFSHSLEYLHPLHTV